MPLACPHCHEPIETTNPPPTSCGRCGGSLPRAAASDITLDYAPQRAARDGETLAPTETAAGQDQRRRVGEYELLRPLGEGGMGVVWEAEQAETGRRVALKLISPSLQPTRETVDRFLREGQLAAAVSHPRSTFVFGAGEEDGQPYIAMELMPGDTLKDILDREGPLPLERAVDCILDVIDGLEAAHAQGVIHRDVKPSNCFLDSEGRVKVGDFGLSKSLISEAELTRTGAFLGTPQFAAPEQVRGGVVTQATDVYAVGATLFCLLTGRGPYLGDAVAVIAQITSEPPPPLRSLRPAVPRAIERIVTRAMQKDPSRRFADLAQLRQALAPFATGGSSIADVGRRLAAYMIDDISLGLIALATTVIASLWLAFRASRNGTVGDRGLLMVTWLPLAQAVLVVSYFALAEARWGRGLGKLLMGLKVVGPDGDRPGYLRSLLRTSFVPGALGLSALLPLLALFQWPNRQPFAWLIDWLPAAFGVICALTMRSRNGYRGLHELVSGTRVIRPRRAEARRQRLPVVAPLAADGIASFGPFRLTGELGRNGLMSVRQARDELLARPVWIVDGPSETAALSASRRAVARSARLHWLQGGQSALRRWDAFEAAIGAPLADAVRCGAQWHQSRWWLLELAEELAAAIADQTLPELLSLAQVWITRTGQVKLLDVAIHPVEAGRPATENPFVTTVDGKVGQDLAEGAGPPAGSPFALMSAETRAIKLLSEAVDLCTRDQLLPSHVREFSETLASRPTTRETLDWAATRLREVARQPTALGWDDRLGVLAVTMGTELMVYMGAAFALLGIVASELHASTLVIALTALLVWVLPAITAFVFRGGPAFWLTRIEVLRADGRRAGRWRCAWRNFVAWAAIMLPYAMMGVLVARLPQFNAATSDGQATFHPEDASTWIFLGGVCFAELLGALSCLGALYALAQPRRGWQDVLAGTYLMPR